MSALAILLTVAGCYRQLRRFVNIILSTLTVVEYVLRKFKTALEVSEVNSIVLVLNSGYDVCIECNEYTSLSYRTPSVVMVQDENGAVHFKLDNTYVSSHHHAHKILLLLCSTSNIYFTLPCSHSSGIHDLTQIILFRSYQLDLDLPPEIKDWEVSHDDLTVEKLLGAGQFGRVFLSILSSDVQSQRAKKYIQTMRLVEGCHLPQMVAVKQLKGS